MIDKPSEIQTFNKQFVIEHLLKRFFFMSIYEAFSFYEWQK